MNRPPLPGSLIYLFFREQAAQLVCGLCEPQNQHTQWFEDVSNDSEAFRRAYDVHFGPVHADVDRSSIAVKVLPVDTAEKEHDQ